jgi:hypothetical protein
VRSVTVYEITIDDAINVANVIADCLPTDADSDLRELALAARRLVREVQEQADELERERARRRSVAPRAGALIDGAPLEERIDAGGWREFLRGRPVHAGDVLYLLTSRGWHVVRYESNVPQKRAFLYLSLPGVRDDVVVPVPREARLAWPEELK